MNPIGDPITALACAVIEQAVNDLKKPTMCGGKEEAETIRESARRFLSCDDLDIWCGIAGVSAYTVRRGLRAQNQN